MIELKIDTRMIHGSAVSQKLRKDRQGGIPWMVVLDGDGTELVTSDGPNGNVGCPVMPEEITWFMQMLTKSSKHMNEKDHALVHTALSDFAEKILSDR